MISPKSFASHRHSVVAYSSIPRRIFMTGVALSAPLLIMNNIAFADVYQKNEDEIVTLENTVSQIETTIGVLPDEEENAIADELAHIEQEIVQVEETEMESDDPNVESSVTNWLGGIRSELSSIINIVTNN
jgi:hypothetical protein